MNHIPTFPAVETNLELVPINRTELPSKNIKEWHLRLRTLVRLFHEGKYYKTIVMDQATFPESSLNNGLLVCINQFIKNCYSMILLGKVNTNCDVYKIDDDPVLGHLSDKEILDLKHRVQKAQYEAWMDNIKSGKGDAAGEFVPSNKQIMDKMKDNE